MRPDLDDLREKEKLNPSETDYNSKFNDMTSRPDMKALDDQGNAIARDDTASRKDVASAEKQAIGDTTAGKAAVAAAGAAGGTLGSTAAKVLGKIKTKKGGAASAIVVFIVIVIVSLVLLAPSALLLNLKENGGKWMTKMTNIGMHKRVRDVMEKRYFADPESCKGIAIKCRFTPGMKDSEIKKLVDRGLIKDTDVKTSPSGKKYLGQMTYTDKTGKTTVVNKSNFRSFYATNLDFSSRLNTVVDARNILTRGKGALKKFSRFGVDRAKPLGDSGDEKTRLQKFRESFYGKKNSLATNVDETTMTEEEKARLAETMDGLQEKADELSKNAVTNGPGTLVPDTGVLDQIDASKIVFSGMRESLEGAFKGLFNGVDAACNVYNTIRILNFAVKAYAAASLIKYASLFLTIADKQKDGEVATAEMALLAGALLRPSTLPDSKGKDFSQSQGANLLFYGKITQPSALSRYSGGVTSMKALQYVYSFISGYGVSASTCSKVLSWWGQILLVGFGIITSIFTGGVGALTGASIGIAKSLALSYIGQVIIPKLVPILAGTVAPDLATDPEGGYGAGNAIAAGFGALGGELGKAVGMRPLTDSQVVALYESDTSKQIAELDSYQQSQRSIFDQENPNSILNSMALAMTPVISRPLSATDFVSSITHTIATGLRSPLQIAYAADQSVLDSYGGKYCEEKTNTFLTDNATVRSLARDANCNLIYGANPATLTDSSTGPAGKFSLDTSVDYMLNNGYITEDGTPTDKGAEGDNTTSYAKFVESCIDGTDPIIDEYSADLQGSENPALCISNSEYVDYYRTYTQYVAGTDGVQDAADDRLGYADASTAATTPTETAEPTPPVNAGGMIWPIDRADWPTKDSTPINECVPAYQFTSGRIGNVHTGIDIMVPVGKKVRAAAAGTVTYSSAGYGMLHIRTNLKDSSGNTLYTNYQHLSTRLVGVGQTVKQGQVIGYSGTTGTGIAHLHFGVWTTSAILSGSSSYESAQGQNTVSKMRHPLIYLPEDGRNVNICKKPYTL